MSINLDKDIRFIKGVGPAKARDFARLGIKTLSDALYDFPFRHDDLSNKLEIADVVPGQKVTIGGTIATITNRRSNQSRKMMVTEAIVQDGTGAIKVVWFHQGFLTKTLRVGTNVSLSGKIDDRYGLSLVNPTYEVTGNARKTMHTGRIVPIYRLCGGLTQKVRRLVVEEALKSIDGEVVDYLPKDIIEHEQFIDLHTALRAMHFPNSTKTQEKALRRLKFDEFFLHQILHSKARRELKKQKASVVKFDKVYIKKIIGQLPFELTAAQKKSLFAIYKDMERDEPMNRLLEGDVGTGKTIVAALAAINTAKDGWQSAFLAPTEILAEQHAKGLHKMFGDKLTVALFTRTKRFVSGVKVTKKQMLDALKNGKIDLAIGTHALLSDNVLFNRLGFIIVDEQHRFGVKQRQSLKDRRGDADGIPHLLSMTATPIPRSLSLVLYGDLDCSILDEYPAGRKIIETHIVTAGRERIYYKKMRDQIDAGHQIFVVCPLIEESDALGVKSVNEIHDKYKKGAFKNHTVGMLHGKMKADEKDQVMQAFLNKEIDVLVATTVVEVGVDIPNATVMFIEGAERFGLAQLHQLRGRVGRDEYQSYCFLHPSEKLTPLAKERLQAVVQSNDGFKLADKDLKLRGGGNIFGTAQSGFEAFKLGSFADMDLITCARDYAKDVLDEDPDLKPWPDLNTRVEEYIQEIHFE
ncbi:ATP-dependent DNA helicase RecG [Candidatus Uhrbacteria bacterium]|nr:ATP-dependent DNA helicase RecG [Candidatus Uhrbacteria bacterium]MBT7717502.1 ATP-dependent DNA helicase RecG [Candidatus Uhrbacteria bacterium]